MKKILISNVRYENFKGLEDYQLNLDGRNASVSGRNALGKTTLFDGFYWLLFGKDSTENAKFDVKPVDRNGNEIIGKEPVVEAELVVDGVVVTLKRELRESWSTVRGRIEKERKSDTTKYFINGVPCKTQKEYQEYIGKIIDESSFKLLTNPFAFNNLHWKDKRDILMGLVSEVSDEEVIKSNPDLKDLLDKLENHSAEDFKAIVKAKLKELKKDIDGMTVRFDEAERAIPHTGDLNESELNAMLQQLNATMDELRKKQAQIENGGTVAQLQNRLDEIQRNVNQLKLEEANSKHIAVNDLKNALNDTKDKQYAAEREITQLTFELKHEKTNHAKQIEARSQLLEQYHIKKNQTFDEHRTACMMCGQDLPSDQVGKMKEEFNTKKATELEDILKKGTETAAEIKLIELVIDDIQIRLVGKEAIKETIATHVLELEAEIRKIESENGQSATNSEAYEKLMRENNEVKAKINNEQESKNDLIRELRDRQASIQIETSRVNEKLSTLAVAEQQNKRLAELKAKHIEYVNTYNEYQGYEFLLDEHTKTRVKLLEAQINAKFEYAQFKLFNLQKNGGVEEICEATYKGIAFSRNLNNAAKINVGLDIINTLSEAYQITAPVFVDNAESVNKLIGTRSQLISLIVSTDQELKVEVTK